jgi:hypothetical protein
LLLCSRDSRCAAEIPKINQHEDRGSGAVRRIREHPGLRAKESNNSPVVSVAGILAAEVALDADSDSTGFMVAIPTVMAAIFMDTDTTTVLIRTVS